MILRNTLHFQFSRTGKLTPNLNFERDSNGKRWNERGIIESLRSNVPRIDFDPRSGECVGLLCEGQSTNMLYHSQELDDSDWLKTNSSVTANDDVSPDGNENADLLVEDTSSGEHYIEQTRAGNQENPHSLFVYVKANGRSEGKLVLNPEGDSNKEANVTFNLNDESISSSTGSNTTIKDYFLDSVGNDWYKVTMRVDGHDDDTGSFNVRLHLRDGSDSYTGDGTSGMYVWGFQLEEGIKPTFYIETPDSDSETRSSENIYTDNMFWLNEDVFTIYLVVSFPFFDASKEDNVYLFQMDDGTTDNQINLRLNSSVGSRGTVTVDGTDYTVENDIDASNNDLIRFAFTVSTNEIELIVNSKESDDKTSPPDSMPSGLEIFRLGSGISNTNVMNGHIREFMFYPMQFGETKLKRLTI